MKNTKRIKALTIAVAIMLCACLLLACSKQSNSSQGSMDGGQTGGDTTGQTGGQTVQDIADGTNRKIIYSYSCSLYTDSLQQTVYIITTALNGLSGAYIESSQSNSSGGEARATYVFRVRSEDLQGFVSCFAQSGQLRDETLKTDDITKNYLDLQAEKAAREAELERLTQLYQKANGISELANISSYISLVQAQLNSINSALINYDSLVTLSKVSVSIFQSAPPASVSFGSQVKSALKNSGKAVAAFFKGALIFIIYVLPFAAIGTAIIVPVRIVYKKRKAKRPPKAPAGGGRGWAYNPNMQQGMQNPGMYNAGMQNQSGYRPNNTTIKNNSVDSNNTSNSNNSSNSNGSNNISNSNNSDKK